jgi:hypothetical protein
MGGRKSRQKGKRGELEVVHLLKAAGLEARRTGQDQAHQAMEKPGDVELEGWNVEVKRRGRMTLNVVREGLAQASDAALISETPVVFWRGDREDWLVTMDAEDWAAREAHVQRLEGYVAASVREMERTALKRQEASHGDREDQDQRDPDQG